MGLFSFIGGLIGGGKMKKASRRAERDQLEYMNKAMGEIQRQFDITRQDYEPARAMLAPSIRNMADMMGFNGEDAQRAGIVTLKDSPLYQSLYRNGEDALLANASATGGMRGGDLQRGLADFGSDMLAQQYDQQLSRLAGMAGMGMGATDSVSQFGANAAGNIANIFGQQGQVRAGGLLTRGGITNSMWKSAGAFGDQVASAAAGGAGGFDVGGAPFNPRQFFQSIQKGF